MNNLKNLIDKKWATEIFLRLVQVNTLSGQENEMANFLTKVLITELGVLPKDITFDEAYKHQDFVAELNGNQGNMFVFIPGYISGLTLGFGAHLDRVKPGMDVKPQVKEGKVFSDGTTVLGADDAAGIGIILNMIKTLRDRRLPHPDIQLVFNVGEEYKLIGSRCMDAAKLVADMIYIFDMEKPNDVLLGACSSNKFTVEISGKKAHAGLHPEKGISATMVVGLALAKMKQKGLWGRINDKQGKHFASVNFVIDKFGPVGTNSVQDFIRLTGEARSFDPAYLEKITREIRKIFEESARLVSSGRQKAKVNIRVVRAYDTFTINRKDEIVKRAVKAMNQVGLKPKFYNRIMGGVDACNHNKYGVPTIALGVGGRDEHKETEYLILEEYYQSCAVALGIATQN